jgi:hypothetical protein
VKSVEWIKTKENHLGSPYLRDLSLANQTFQFPNGQERNAYQIMIRFGGGSTPNIGQTIARESVAALPQLVSLILKSDPMMDIFMSFQTGKGKYFV